MPLYVLECSRGHRREQYMTVASMERVEKAGTLCPECKIRRKTVVVFAPTGTPILKSGGVGGFFRPTLKENSDVNG